MLFCQAETANSPKIHPWLPKESLVPVVGGCFEFGIAMHTVLPFPSPYN
jgi:hypothetical protein